MRFDTLDQWLEWQMQLHGKAIDLGLDRVRRVGDRLGLERIARNVITVAGTNGKGSTVAAYETWLRQAGFEVASYTSPHLLRYNERIKRNLEAVGDSELCAAFAAVEEARGGTTLTYFEFGTLAALYLFQQWQPDYALLEVGLGGRLDAVNIIDADLVHLTPIGIDHQAWLGEGREQIGFEKAGVLRDGIKVVLNDPDPPQSVLDEIERRGCDCLQLGRDYRVLPGTDGRFRWQSAECEIEIDCVLPGAHQELNLAGVIAGLSQILSLDDYRPEQINAYFRGMRVAGRFESVRSPLAGSLYLDVGHNPDAARVLAASLERIRPEQGRIVVLLGMLEDKLPREFVAALASTVDAWWLTSLDCDRGLDADRLRERIGSAAEIEAQFENPAAALAHALSSLGNKDIMLATGSFVTVELLLRALPDSRELNQYGPEY
ncbi:MAG: folylpolyglutamate synthase/dihydrofolate synthase family protein [Gammaproteobacteria bacterium]|jgi:dihydrofolate synthase/folylpolyglutamate synthase